MIYLDTSVALAQLLSEDRRPADSLWDELLITSRLLQYEVWTRIHSMKLAGTVGEAARRLLGRLAFVELAPPVLERALEPFPLEVRTLDAIHLAAMDFLRRQGQSVELASYDERQKEAARSLGIPIREL